MTSHVVWSDVLISAFCVIINTFALLCNGMVLYTIHKYPRLQNFFNVFVASMAIVDICNTTFKTPLTVVTLLSEWRSLVSCIINNILACLITMVLLTSLALMTINRYYRVVKPAKFPQIFTVKRSLLFALASWLISFVLFALSFAATRSIIERKLKEVQCFHVNNPVLGVFTYLLIFVAPPSTVVVVFYIKTLRFISKSKAAISPVSCMATARLYAEEAKTLKVLLILLISWCCSTAPATTLFLLKAIMSDAPHYFFHLELIFGNMVSLVIPAVYIFVSRYYRKELFKVIICKRESP